MLLSSYFYEGLFSICLRSWGDVSFMTLFVNSVTVFFFREIACSDRKLRYLSECFLCQVIRIWLFFIKVRSRSSLACY